MQRCGAPISCGVHDEIGRRRIPLIQPGADPHHQRHCCCLRSGSSVHHYWHSGRGWHRRKHCRAGRLLARLRSRRRRRSRRRPAQAHPVCGATTPNSLSTQATHSQHRDWRLGRRRRGWKGLAIGWRLAVTAVRPGPEVTDDLSHRPKAGTGDLSDGRRLGPAGVGDYSMNARGPYHPSNCKKCVEKVSHLLPMACAWQQAK